MINYNQTNASNNTYINYQGLPLNYRNVYYDINGEKIHFKEFIDYNKDNRILKYLSDDDNVIEVYAIQNKVIYPYFNKNDNYDGNPYYQMNGGWIKNYPYMFDINNRIVSSKTLTDEQMEIEVPLHTETIDSIKKVNNVRELVELPYTELNDGDVYYVNDLNKEYCVISNTFDKELYDVNTDYKGYKYLQLKVYNHSIYINDNIILEGLITIQTPYNDYGETFVNLSQIDDGNAVNIYFSNSGDTTILLNGEEENIPIDFEIVDFKQDTNYFQLYDKSKKSMVYGDGWNQLTNTSETYLRLSTLRNYFKGNNPHNGHNQYDNGYKYIENFSRLFNYAYDNDLFDERMYHGQFYDESTYINQIGFKPFINEENNDYKLVEDSKIHYFGNYFNIDWNDSKQQHDIVNDVIFDIDKTPEQCWYDYNDYSKSLNDIDIDLNTVTASTIDINRTSDKLKLICKGAEIDASNYQIVNTKVMTITFYLKSADELSKEYQEEIKYYQSVVMPYVEQMIPSTAILNVVYEKN